MKRQVKKLTPKDLKRIVNEEVQNVREEFEAKSLDGAEEAEETEADELADTAPAAKALGEIRKLKIREAKLRKMLAETLKRKQRLIKTL